MKSLWFFIWKLYSIIFKSLETPIWKTKQLNGPGNNWELRETGPWSETYKLKHKQTTNPYTDFVLICPLIFFKSSPNLFTALLNISISSSPHFPLLLENKKILITTCQKKPSYNKYSNSILTCNERQWYQIWWFAGADVSGNGMEEKKMNLQRHSTPRLLAWNLKFTRTSCNGFLFFPSHILLNFPP